MVFFVFVYRESRNRRRWPLVMYKNSSYIMKIKPSEESETLGEQLQLDNLRVRK